MERAFDPTQETGAGVELVRASVTRKLVGRLPYDR